MGVGFVKMDPASNHEVDMDLNFDLSVQGGLMFTIAAVPGLFAQAYYHYNFIMGDIIKDNGLIGIALGYGF
jgi:hypothetical protein